MKIVDDIIAKCDEIEHAERDGEHLENAWLITVIEQIGHQLRIARHPHLAYIEIDGTPMKIELFAMNEADVEPSVQALFKEQLDVRIVKIIA